MVRLLVLSLAVLVAAGLAGCSKGGPSRAPVRGTVTLDKKPLADGQIVFVTPGKAPEALPIANGAFDGSVEVGERKVEILAYKDAPGVKMDGEPDTPSKVNYLPTRYNSASQLTATVKPEGTLDLKFDLTSNP